MKSEAAAAKGEEKPKVQTTSKAKNITNRATD